LDRGVKDRMRQKSGDRCNLFRSGLVVGGKDAEKLLKVKKGVTRSPLQ